MTFQLQPCAFTPLPMSAIEPRGWLRRQLRIQADGLSGHLADFWPDVRDSRWFGGRAEGWERAPYWLDGAIPLAFLLDDQPLKAKVCGYVDFILRHQAEDGWLGPGGRSAEERNQTDLWSLFLALKALAQYGDATGDDRVPKAIGACLGCIGRHIGQAPLFKWGMFRSFEAMIPLLGLYEHTGDAGLIDIATKINCQGFDWASYYENWPATDRVRATGWTFAAHVVNTGMILKAPALWWRLRGGERLRRLPRAMLDLLDAHHGQVSGVFSGDECLAGKDPTQGTELCAVVETMYSLEVLTGILGDAYFADRLEQVAFNALPATFSPDMWTHQYDQQANQVACTLRPNPRWTTNGPDANTFGLEPNYGCCTADLSQGWPKFAAHLWMSTADGGLAAVAYAPCHVHHCIGAAAVEVQVDTEYPFRERIAIEVRTDRPAEFPLLLRIPAWAAGATATVAGEGTIAAAPGQFLRLHRAWSGATRIELTLPMRPVGQRQYANSLSITRGPLVYALKIGEEWTRIRADMPYREPPHADYEVRATTPWNYALAAGEKSLARDVVFAEHPVGDCPFSPDGAPVTAQVGGRRLPQWQETNGDAVGLPQSPVASDQPEEKLTLIPYGCTNLRIAEFPTLK